MASCTYSSEEPGLLGRPPASVPSRPAPTPTWNPPTPSVPRPTPASGLPVLGQAEWTSADGRAVTVRIAVHAVRRTAGGTVLDWSVTPLSAPGLSSAGVPRFDLGLLTDGRPAVALLDGGAVYRPVRLPAGRCVCSLIGPTADGWRINETRLLQLAFPGLPRSSAVDVAIATMPVVSGVPVTAAGRLPSPDAGVDLARPANQPPPYLAGPGFDYPTGQRLTVQPYRVVAAATATTLVWRVQALTAGPGLGTASAPPLVGSDERITGNEVAASGPVLVVGGRRLTARVATDQAAGPGTVACLCTDLRSGTAGLRSADQLATLVTTYDPLPVDAREVLVDFPGYGQRRIDVSRQPARGAAATVADPRPRTWTSNLGQPPIWGVSDWPTPVPDRRLLESATGLLDTLIR